MNLKVSEVFYSPQGEGARAGAPSIFIRLSGCSAKHACFQYGVRCDTEFESGVEESLDQLLVRILQLAPQCKWIIWTGGEPCDQLTDEAVAFFKHHGYKQAIETSGLKTPPAGLDFITVSPKVGEHVVAKMFKGVRISELRYVWGAHKPGIPEPLVEADHYYLSPHSDGYNINYTNLAHCIELCKQYPKWSVSVQQHKLWGVL